MDYYWPQNRPHKSECRDMSSRGRAHLKKNILICRRKIYLHIHLRLIGLKTHVSPRGWPSGRSCRVTHRRRTRLSSHSSPGSNPLDNDPTYSSSLSPMTIRSSLFPPDILGVLVPFLYASGYALIFTPLLVLRTEDDSSDSKALGEQQSQFASHQRRFVGSSEMERESSMRSHSSHHGYSPVPTNVVGSFPSFGHRYYPHQATSSVRCLHKVIWCVSIALAPFSSTYLCAPQLSISLILDLIARLQVHHPHKPHRQHPCHLW